MAARRRNRGKASPAACFLIGAVILFMALEMAVTGYLDDKKTNALKERCTADTIAVVENITVETKTRTHRRNKRTYHETYYEYTSLMDYEVDGQAYQLVDVRTSSDFKQGEQVSIKYDPDDPGVYYLQRYNDGNKFKISLIPVSVLTLMAVLMFISGFRSKKKKLNNGMTFEQWQEQQLKKEQETSNARMDSVDMTAAGGGLAPNIRGSLNSTEDYMESIGGDQPGDNGQ